MLLPEFADSRVCAHCGAPAARLGHTWKGTAGDTMWESEPLELGHVTDHNGTRPARSGDVGAFAQGKGYAVAYTHECRGDKSCGVLTLNATRQGTLPKECEE